ncbi:hypothetical protein M426DRAFT_145725 [Hypoxylon sp. CI-4A]|nr:hypothetical protein M426DRAFT_145725 [Hypoxylon sp. CI-4A]
MRRLKALFRRHSYDEKSDAPAQTNGSRDRPLNARRSLESHGTDAASKTAQNTTGQDHLRRKEANETKTSNVNSIPQAPRPRQSTGTENNARNAPQPKAAVANGIANDPKKQGLREPGKRASRETQTDNKTITTEKSRNPPIRSAQEKGSKLPVLRAAQHHSIPEEPESEGFVTANEEIKEEKAHGSRSSHKAKAKETIPELTDTVDTDQVTSVAPGK